MAQLKIFMTGAFRVEAADGADLTPKGAKECGLLALLLTSQGGQRSRAWLQTKLWSDRGKEQASASLRQALVQIRKRLGTYADIIIANRSSVTIDVSSVDMVHNPGFEFLEGIDVRDEEFEYWLSCERSARQSDDPSAPSAQPIPAAPATLQKSILVCNASDPSAPIHWAERLVSDVMIRSLVEEFALPVIQGEKGSHPSAAWIVTVEGSTPVTGQFGVRIALCDSTTGRQLWSGFRVLRNYGAIASDQPEILKMAYELSESVAESIVLSQKRITACQDPDALSRLALRRLFTMRPDMVESADELFARAYEVEPRGVYLAWRAQVREVQKLERLRTDLDTLSDETEELTRTAMEREPNNSMVLALLANTRLYVDNDASGSLELARRSVRINPGNPMAWWSLSAARMMLSDAETSYKAAQFARYLTQKSQFSFWSEAQLAGAAIALGRLDEARDLFKSASATCPQFRPALRHLLALYAQDGNWEQAEQTIRSLQKVEPGFTPEQMVYDSSYPVNLLRKSEGVDLSRLAAVS